MAKVEFFGQYEKGTRLGFLNTQIDYRNLFVNGADLDFRGSAKTYTITDAFTDTVGQDVISQTILKGNLKANRPFNQRKIKSVESIQFDPITGEQTSVAKYSGLKNLTLDQFIDSGVDSLKNALSGNDQIFGNEFQTTVLSGYKGDDELFIETFNKAVGGAGRDIFYLSKDTRLAEIIDFNPDKDSIFILDDLASNYRFETFFGETIIVNNDGERLAIVNDFGLDETNQPAIISGTNVQTFGDV